MAGEEIYPNPPVALALVEAKHPVTETLTGPALLFLKQSLAETLPIQRSEESLQFDVHTGDRKVSRYTRFVSRDLHTSVTYKEDAIVLETTAYEGWTWFRHLLAVVLRARLDYSSLDAVERIGLRYVNEIRVPPLEPKWREWVRDGLVGPLPKDVGLNLTLKQRQGLSEFEAGRPNETITLRYSSGDGQAVISTPNLTRPAEGDGKYFLLDIDAAWNPPREGVPEFDPDFVDETLSRLHEGAAELFEFCITDKLREEVLRRA